MIKPILISLISVKYTCESINTVTCNCTRYFFFLFLGKISLTDHLCIIANSKCFTRSPFPVSPLLLKWLKLGNIVCDSGFQFPSLSAKFLVFGTRYYITVESCLAFVTVWNQNTSVSARNDEWCIEREKKKIIHDATTMISSFWCLFWWDSGKRQNRTDKARLTTTFLWPNIFYFGF